MFAVRVAYSVLWNTVTYGAVLFLTAGTLHWWRAWVLMAMIAAGTTATMLLVFRTRPDLFRERRRGLIQRGQPMADRVLVIAFLIAYAGSLVFTVKDVFVYHLLPRPGVWVSSAGLGLVVAGWLVISLVFRENSFAAPVVKHQQKRGHKVIDTGVYRIVRHPMYAGIFLLNVGIALWLESYAGAIAALGPIAILAVRIVYEERFLRVNLDGYGDYAERVRWRLVPFVW